MDDLEVVQTIDELVGEEHRLRQAHAGTALGTTSWGGCATSRWRSISAGTCYVKDEPAA
jgi:hypothetical protein